MAKITIGAAALFAGLALTTLGAPALAVTSTANVAVGITATTEATIGVGYSAGSSIVCNVGAAVSGFVACTNTANVTGSFRTTVVDVGGSSVSITGAAIPGTATNSIAPSALQMTCTGGTTGGASFPGTAGTLATNTPLSTSAVPCQSWSGTVVDGYSLVVALAIDASKVPSDTYTTTNFTATATAN